MYWFRYGSFFITKKNLYTDFQWLTQDVGLDQTLQNIFLTIKYFVGVGTFLFALYANFHVFKSIKSIIFNRYYILKEEHSWFLLYTGGSFISVLLVSLITPVDFSYWHLLIVFFPAIFPIFLEMLNSSIKYPKRWRYLFVFIILYSSIVNISVFLSSQEIGDFTFKKGPHESFFEKSEVWGIRSMITHCFKI